MVFLFEADGVRPEIQYGASGSIRVVPKYQGTPVDVGDLSDATYSILTSDGVSLGTGVVSVSSATLGSRTVGYYDVPIPSVSKVYSDVVLEVVWPHASATVAPDLVLFDIVRAPLGDLVSMSDLMSIRSDLEDSLIRIGNRLGFPVSTDAERQTAAEAATRSFAESARIELQARLYQRAERDGQPRPHQLLDRRQVARIEARFALMALYEAVAKDPTEGEDSASGFYRHYRDEASRMLEQLRIAYTDLDTDLEVADETSSYGRTFNIRRSY